MTDPVIKTLLETCLQHSAEDGTSSNTASQAVDLCTGLVDIKGTNDDQTRVRRKVTDRDGDALDNIFVDGIDVVLELGRDRDNGCRVGNGSLDKLLNGLVVFQCCRLIDQINFVLKNDDVFQFHNLDGGQMFARLRLRARFVGGDQQQSSVHDRSTVQHCGHKNIVS